MEKAPKSEGRGERRDGMRMKREFRCVMYMF